MTDAPRPRGLVAPLLLRFFVRDWRDSDRQAVRVRVGILASIVGIVTNFVMFVLKLASGLLIASLSLIADAFDSLGDVVQGFITLLGFKVAGKGPDRGHPYGHERAEEIAGVVVAVLLILAGLGFGAEAIRRLLRPPETEYHVFALGVGVVSMFVKFGLSRMSFTFARLIQSRVIRGNAWNYFSDVLASGLTVVAVVGRRYGIYWLDPAMAILIGLLIVRVGFSLFRESSDHLMGKGGSPREVEEIHQVACGQRGVLGCSDIEVHKYGRKRLVNLRIQVSDALTLREAHEIADRVERKVKEAHADWDPIVHVDPVSTQVPRGGHTIEALGE